MRDTRPNFAPELGQGPSTSGGSDAKMPAMTHLRFCAALLCAGLNALLATPAAAQTEPPALQLVNAFPGQKKFDRPLYVAFTSVAPGHAFVVEQNGRVWQVPREGDGEGERTPFLDFYDRILHPKSGGHNEEGLLGFAFDPSFADNKHVWLYWTEKIGETTYERRGRTRTRALGQSVIARYDVEDADGVLSVDPDSELRVFELEQPYGNHNGGTIEFGPDGMMYVAIGDGGSANDPHGHGQNRTTLFGTILRIDVRNATADEPYAIPEDNPFYKMSSARNEIWAYGLRNPWRITFDRETGELWCGDVGQKDWEEVDRIVKGGNYGWNLREGSHEFPPGRDDSNDPDGLIEPIAEYGRRAGISITGGYVYRGKAIPALQGWFVYGDFATRTIWAVHSEAKGVDDEVIKLGTAKGPLASFAETPDGELLIACYDGRVYRIEPIPE